MEKRNFFKRNIISIRRAWNIFGSQILRLIYDPHKFYEVFDVRSTGTLRFATEQL